MPGLVLDKPGMTTERTAPFELTSPSQFRD